MRLRITFSDRARISSIACSMVSLPKRRNSRWTCSTALRPVPYWALKSPRLSAGWRMLLNIRLR
jgi:hypothetical protein